MAKFVYNNAKNANIGYISFELNCSYYLYILYKENLDFRSKSKSIDKLIAKLRDLIIVYRENL